MTTRLSHPWYNLVDAIHACYNLVFSVWVPTLRSVEELADTSTMLLTRSTTTTMVVRPLWTAPMFQACL